jgi:hypothetical protein
MWPTGRKRIEICPRANNNIIFAALGLEAGEPVVKSIGSINNQSSRRKQDGR